MGYRYYPEKTKRLEKLSRTEQENLLFDLINAFSLVKTVKDSALFIQDLLTKNETKVLAKRLRIAKLLLAGEKYSEIAKELHTSYGTVSKIGSWLAQSGEGLRTVVKKLPARTEAKQWTDYTFWDRVKRKYPLYFWPELVIDGIIESLDKEINKEEEERLRQTLTKLKDKDRLNRTIQRIWDEKYKKLAKVRRRQRLERGNQEAGK